MSDKAIPVEGQLYKEITIAGHTFKILYGYYNDAERARGEPTPIFPDFEESPVYSHEGYPIVNRIQDACMHYRTVIGNRGDGWCADCVHYPNEWCEIGECRCEHRRRDSNEKIAEFPEDIFEIRAEA